MLGARIGVAIGTIVVSLLLAEFVLRVFQPFPSDRLLPFPYNDGRVRRIAANDTYLQFDHDLGWSLAPNRSRRDDGLLFRTNNRGLRADVDYSEEPPAGTKRLEAFGDSFTHCSEVTQKDCWVPVLEHTLAQTEVMNFGVTAYGPDQAWLRYQRDGREFKPCGVLIGYFTEDIDRVVNRFRPFIFSDDGIVMSKPRFLLDGDGLQLLPNPTTQPKQLGDPQWVEQTLGPHDSWYFPGTFVADPFDASWVVRLARTAAYKRSRTPLLRTETTYPAYSSEQEAYQVTGRILIQFAKQVQADGASPVVVIFPGKRDLTGMQAGVKPYSNLVDWLERERIPTVDLSDRMMMEAGQEGIPALFNILHYSKLGDAAVADELAKTVPELTSGTCSG
jgi:hypothetical protein